MSSYFKQPFANRKIVVDVGGNLYNTTTNGQGGFLIEVNQRTVENVDVIDGKENVRLPVVQAYPVDFHDTNYPLAVISDVDDTLLVSYTASTLKRIRTILFTSSEKRKSISFTKKILNTIQDQKGRVFYVSKSESNLFGLLTAVIHNQKLPKGSLILTSYLRYSQLLSPKKGKDFKEQSIMRIINNSPDKSFILMGDDTQQDMQVYTRISELYPKRILKVYIRKTRKQLLGNKKQQLALLKNTGVPVRYFSDQDPVEEEIEIINKLNN